MPQGAERSKSEGAPRAASARLVAAQHSHLEAIEPHARPELPGALRGVNDTATNHQGAHLVEKEAVLTLDLFESLALLLRSLQVLPQVCVRWLGAEGTLPPLGANGDPPCGRRRS